jgi:galactonate dehydratase
MTRRKIGRIETFYAPPRWLFVRVESEDGAVGWGEASLEGWAEAVDGAFEAFRDRFIGADPFNIEDIWQVGYRGGFYRGGPVLMSALSGLEQALWDLKGRALGLPAWQMLGGKVRDKVRSYAWIGGDRPHEIGAAAEGRKSQGFTAVKMNATAELDWIGTPRLFDLDRKIRNVGRAYKQLIADWRGVLPAQSVCLVVPIKKISDHPDETDDDAAGRHFNGNGRAEKAGS